MGFEYILLGLLGLYWILFCSMFAYVLIKEWLEERRAILSYDIINPGMEISTLPTIIEVDENELTINHTCGPNLQSNMI